jgi:hypothetical protein
MSNLTVENLPPEQFRSAYPLIREALPNLDLAGWLRFARQTAAARKAGRAGIVAARRTSRPYPCGLFCYRVDQDLGQGRVLIAEHFVAVDLLEPGAVLAALVAELDKLGPRLGCTAVRSIVHGNAAEGSGGALAKAGHTEAGTILFKPLQQEAASP